MDCPSNKVTINKMNFISSYKTALILAPHTDDGELGCGGTIARLIDEGSDVYYAAFSTAAESVPKEFPSGILKKEVRNATLCLGIPSDNLFVYDYPVRKLNFSRQDILEDLVQLRSRLSPDLVLMPSLNDFHQDHATVAEEGLRAFKHVTILGYELPWNNLSINHQCFIKLQPSHMERKVAAVSEYRSQGRKSYVSEESIFSLGRTRGVQIDTEFAELFEVVRWIL